MGGRHDSVLNVPPGLVLSWHNLPFEPRLPPPGLLSGPVIYVKSTQCGILWRSVASALTLPFATSPPNCFPLPLSLLLVRPTGRHVNIDLIFFFHYNVPETLLSLPLTFPPAWLLLHLFLPEVLLSPSAISFLLPLYQSPSAAR